MDHQPNHQDELVQLLDAAKKAVGSDGKVGKLIGQQSTTISDWRNGRRTCTPEDQALLAAVAGLDPIATLARATVYRHEGKAKGDLLMKALGKALRATGGTIASAGVAALAIFCLTASLVGGSGLKRHRI